MGTSKSFAALTKRMPNWPALSSTVTRSCNGGPLSTQRAKEILSGYVTAIGGATKAGRGGSGVAGIAGIRTALKLGGFFAAFNGPGGNFAKAMARTGMDDLTGKSVSEIIDHLIEYSAGPASLIDDKAAKEASRLLLEELLGAAKTVEEMEAILKGVFSRETEEELLVKYFGYYIYEHLATWFYEKLVTDKGKTECTDLMRQIKDFIVASLADMNKKNSLKKVDWNGEEAKTIVKNIQQDILIVFENEN